MTACPFCSAALPAAAKFCLSCGQALDATAAPTMTSPDAGAVARASRDSDSFDHGRFAPGTMLGDRYRIVGRLGVGGMGEVFRADDLALGQPVALKFLPEAVERDPDRLEQLTAEIRTARQISHPNVCRVYDLGEVQGRRFLTMEYVDGEDLRSLLRRIGRLPEDKGLEIARQLCAGLAAIHDRDVLHRDLKPANIMLDGRGRVRLTDFGLATAVAGAGTDGAIAGTPAYMAPEQLAGEPLSVATDLYALGLVLFEIFTGERLQAGDSVEAIRQAQETIASTLTSSASGAKLDPTVQRVIARCLDPDPARRPPSAVTVAAALPGGDPLAAALAAGETPSPQMVAAAGESGGLSFRAAGTLLVALVSLLFAVTALSGRNSVETILPFPHPPQVLASKATDVLIRLGYTDPAVDSAFGFWHFGRDYVEWINDQDTLAQSWQDAAVARPSLVRFWHRTSAQPLQPSDFFGVGSLRQDPPMARPGMTYLELDPLGRLVKLDVVLPEQADPAAESDIPDWSALFDAAGLDIAEFVPMTPEWISRTGSDARAAWTGPGAHPGGAQLRVEAAAFHGRPVFFRTIGPWTQAVNVPQASDARDTNGFGRQDLVNLFGLVVVFGIPAVGIALAARNVRLGRTDTRGATRLAVATGAVLLLAGMFELHYSGFAVVSGLMMDASGAGFAALVVWTFYAAVEPYVRRRWPQMLISWSRLVDGRWRDPLVGRDLLVGLVCGVMISVLLELVPIGNEWIGAEQDLRFLTPLTWAHPRFEAASLLSSIPDAATAALAVVLLLVLMRLAFKSQRGAVMGAGALGIALGLTTPGFLNPFGILSIVLIVGTFAIAVTRFGLLTLTSLFFVFSKTFLSFSAPDFLTGHIVLTAAAVLGAGVFGFYAATRGQAATGWLDG